MEIYFYSNPRDNGQSVLIRRALKEADIKVIEINPFNLMPENKNLIKHRLSVVPCIIIEFGGIEYKRIEHRIESGFKTYDQIKNFINNNSMVRARLRVKKEKAIALEIERQAAISLEYEDVALEKQQAIGQLQIEISSLSSQIEDIVEEKI